MTKRNYYPKMNKDYNPGAVEGYLHRDNSVEVLRQLEATPDALLENIVADFRNAEPKTHTDRYEIFEYCAKRIEDAIEDKYE